MLTYIIKMVVCSVFLFLYYYVFLRNKQFHHYNRFYLLFATGLSFLIPLARFEWFILSGSNERVVQLMNILYISNAAEEIVVDNAHTTSIPPEWIAYCISGLITFVLLLLFVKRIRNIYRLKRTFSIQKMEKYNLINTNIQEAPFSFFRNLFWRKDISLQEEAGQQIFRHEMAHIEQRHSWDRTFMQIVKAVCWFNPVFYFIEKELVLIHEYIADEKAIANKDGRAFAAMLLRSRIDHFGYSPGQAIFYSSIKKRLQMLTNHQKTKYSQTRRWLVLPLLASILFVFACQNADNKEKAVKPTDSTTLLNNTIATSDSTAVVAELDKESFYPGDWESFLRTNLNQDTPVDNGAPPGRYRVTVRFNVDVEGNVSEVEALNDPGYGTAAETVRAIKAGGKWAPAMKDGQKVASLKKQSIVFLVEE